MPIYDFPQERYFKLSSYLKSITGGKKVQKINVDARFSCPNLDGKISSGGCIYCDNRGFSLNTRKPVRPLATQIEEGIKNLKKRYGSEKFIVYFQAFTNTYAGIAILKKEYDIIKDFPEVIGLSIATRPDCINKEIVELIDSYAPEYEVWLELGLQSVHEKTLEFINRGHTYEEFLKALDLIRKNSAIKVCAHVILGLPGETEEMMMETANKLAELKLEGVKIHPLYVVKGTKLEELFQEGKYMPLEFAEFNDLAVNFLERLPADMVIQRISADCPHELLVAPKWIIDKNKYEVLKAIEDKLVGEDKFQGRLYKEEPCPQLS
ncbi:TIGR01212 family radical SAM protein [bacterium]|nr:MAG: TIGR01212 family radical SAM protein [bacterium]